MNDCFDHIIEKGCTRYIYKVKVIPDSEVLEMRTCSNCNHYIDIKLLMKCIGCAKLTCESCKKCRQCRRGKKMYEPVTISMFSHAC